MSPWRSPIIVTSIIGLSKRCHQIMALILSRASLYASVRSSGSWTRTQGRTILCVMHKWKGSLVLRWRRSSAMYTTIRQCGVATPRCCLIHTTLPYITPQKPPHSTWSWVFHRQIFRCISTFSPPPSFIFLPTKDLHEDYDQRLQV